MVMLIEKFNYKKIHRETLNGLRYYTNNLGQRLPSVTTVLEHTKSEESKRALQEWRKRIGLERAQEITNQAASRGTRLHKWLEIWVQSGVLGEPGTNPYSRQSHAMAQLIINQGFKRISEVWGNEIGVYFPELYAGTTDCVGLHDGEPTIFDFKQSNKLKKREYIEDYFLQTVAYALAHNAIHDTKISKGVVMIAVWPEQESSPQYQEFVIEHHDFDHYVNVWCDRVSKYYKTHK